MPKSFGSPTGLAIVIGLIVGIGVLFMGFAIFYKFIVMGPEERWNNAPSQLRSESQPSTLPSNPYRNNTVVPEPRVAHHPSQAYGVPTADVEMGGVSAFHTSHSPKADSQKQSSHSASRRSHSHDTTVVPVVEAVLYESDMDAYLPNEAPATRRSVADISASDARAQAMRDWYDN